MRANYLFKKLLVTSLILFISLTQTIYVKADDGFDNDNNQTTNTTVKSPSSNDTEVPNTNNEVNNEETSVTYNAEDYYYVDDVNQYIYIYIYSYKQLSQIGTGNHLYTGDKDGNIGEGELIDGVFYNSDSNYILKNDVELDANNIWTVPDSFTGTINNGSAQDYPLYDKSSDAIYIYNPYQLKVLAQDNSENEPVMSMDYDAAQFGMGQMIYPNGEDQSYLTYSKSHRYVISKYFNSDRPENIAEELKNNTVSNTVMWLDGEKADGRTKPGQVYAEIGGKKYILIGNESQLRAIGSNKDVTPRLYYYYTAGLLTLLKSPSYSPYYPGDADLGLDAVAKKGIANNKEIDVKGDQYLFYKDNGKYTLANIDLNKPGVVEGLLEGLGGLLGGLLGTLTIGEKEICGVDENGYPNKNTASLTKLQSEYDGLKYSSNANYIIFRNIDLSANGANSNGDNDLWTPLMVSGDIVGAKLADGQTQITDGTSILATGKPVISNVNVNQTEEMDGSKYIGIGFFGTITNEIDVGNIGVSKGTVTVSNIELRNISVKNNTNKHKNTQTIISGLTTLLGGVLGVTLDALLGILSFGNLKLNLKDTLSQLLNARANDPTIYATGTFAGRIVGDVQIKDCDVTGNVTVSNINSRTGGFVGYTEGVTQYDGLSKVLGTVAGGLSTLLNLIPGLGLGDLITILLENALDVKQLIPTGYKNVEINNCNVSGLTGTIGQNDVNYIGGFVGQQVGTKIFNSSIKDSTYTINSNEYGGGFAGVARDADIKGTLSSIGIELIRGMQPQSLNLNCNINNSSVSVSGTNYQGGFTGAQANSYLINCGIDGSVSVKATGSYAGGMSGIATVGWVTNLGSKEVKDPSLLKTVNDLLVGLLSTDPEQAGMLLSLVGIASSAILGCNLNCSSITVETGKSYAGGVLGGGDGVYLAESSEEYLKKLSYWKYGKPETSVVVQRDNNVSGLKTVTAGENRAGGIVGSVTTASITGLLNNTLGVGQFLGFTVRNFTVNGVNEGYRVSAKENYAGGAIGEAVGGDVNNVTLNNLKSIIAGNRAGGFVGCAGPGDLAGTGGLTLNLLGLNNLLKISNLLSVADSVRVKISNTHVNGIIETPSGLIVQTTGTNAGGGVTDYVAGGFIGKANSCEINDSDVKNLEKVSANQSDGVAGGFIGSSQTGGLADVADDAQIREHFTEAGVIQINNLLGAITYLVPKYTNCTVTYVDGGSIEADVAGGFVGELQSGHVNNQGLGDGKYYSVYNIDQVKGSSYAGGFAGKAYSGALANSGKGISILGGLNGLGINIGDLLNIINAYVPIIEYAGVKSDKETLSTNTSIKHPGFTVSATTMKDSDNNSGSAGGFIGYGSGVQISYCDVSNLKNTEVTAPKDLEADDASSYYNNSSKYAVTGARYASGYIGYMNIGSAASVGSGISVLGKTLDLSDVLSALNVVVSTIEHSNVYGSPGGYAVRASWKNSASDATLDQVSGDAGGFAGKISGGHIQDCNSYNFSYIIGQITAGGYVGDMEPGSVADVLGETNILGGLVNTQETLASLVQDFVPTIRNSSTTCIPCGGAVRADGESTTTLQRGLAGGYVGHNEGGHIWGNDTRKWKGNDYTGTTSLCEAVRIRSVYGREIAGGYTGLMESADTASTGSLSLLWGLVKVDNVLGALSIIYPTDENTAVYGPLANLDINTWNSWVDYVGKYGGYGSALAQNGKVSTQDELNAILNKYIYGYNVVAGRNNYKEEVNVSRGGAAGGYVGSMITGAITNAQAHHAKLVNGARCAGGFAGEMLNGGAADLGGVNILGLNLQLGQMLKVLQVFVPVIKQSSTEGYQSGLTVKSNGTIEDKEGYAGGYVGKLVGGQVWGNETIRCQITKLRMVEGTNYVGGFVGSSKPGSVATVNPTAGEGLFLSKLLNKLLSTPSDLIQVLNATVATIRYADVKSVDNWGIVINGSSNNNYAKAAGGFAGSLVGTVLGKKDTELAGVSAKGVRSVVGGEYVGGFFGLADVAADVQISGKNETELLKYLLQLGRTDVLDTFRTYIYYGQVDGSNDAGLSVKANTANKYGQNDAVTYSGNAGGFGGSLLNSSVKNSKVINLSNVEGLNSAGGFIGYSGKSGVVNLDKVDVLGNNQWQLLGGAVGALDVFGSHIEDSSVSGIKGGYTVQSTNGGEQQIAGGFIGYANLSRMSNCVAGSIDSTIGLKQVASGGVAGGFAGKTNYEYLGNIDLDSTVVNALLTTVNSLVKALYLDKLQATNLLNINLGIIQIKAFYEGDLLSVNLFGLKISVGLSKASTENNQQTDLAIIRIGDTVIKLPCDKDGIKEDNDTKSNISVSLIKANRTKIVDSKVYGIDVGYDVYAGGANYDKDGSGINGISGGFVGFNKEGLLQNNDMFYCDVVRGSVDKVGPFSGYSSLNSTYDFNTKEKIEGTTNNYRIYRKLDKTLDEIKKNADKLNINYEKGVWDTYTLCHMNTVKQYDTLKDAQITDSTGSTNVDLKAYESSAKAVLMNDAKTHLNTGDSATPEPSGVQDPCDEFINLTINKVWKDYYNVNNQRPDSITVTISRSWTDKNGQEHTEKVYESYKISGSLDKTTWQEVISGLPAYKVDGTDETKLYYYTYSVTEKEVGGYVTTIEKSNDGFTFTITNRQSPKLPDTGGTGDLVYVIVGIGVILLAFRKKNTKKQCKRI
ncbi:MAG: Cna B-type domain-containing protein [Solobacterium sp.]|nr:Cna B-type domain-containing protein [Solobacterium sp.]